jgi:fructosamine-3-kinase
MSELLVRSLFKQHFPHLTIQRIQTVFGGSINKNYLVFTNSELLFVKVLQTKNAEKIHQAEKKSLTILKQHIKENTVEVIDQIQTQGYSMLIENGYEMNDIEPKNFSLCAEILVKLHQKTNTDFGLEFDNFIYSLPQKNSFCSNWSEFFYSFRIEPQIAMARNQQFISKKECDAAEALAYRLSEIFPEEPASLLHGDFWSGNFKQSEGKILFFNPATYFGHREMDIAMTFMFDKLPESFYQTYNNLFPLEKNWKKRIDICNIYSYLVHLNLFGVSYSTYIKETLKPFVN